MLGAIVDDMPKDVYSIISDSSMSSSGVLFLDIDGVLHTSSYDKELGNRGLDAYDTNGPLFSPSCIYFLNMIVEETNAALVISSSWKDSVSNIDSIKIIRTIWEERLLPGKIIDITPTLSYDKFKHLYPDVKETLWKGCEIDLWLQQNSWVQRYAICDDQNICLPYQKQYFVKTNQKTGLNKKRALKLIKILQS